MSENVIANMDWISKDFVNTLKKTVRMMGDQPNHFHEFERAVIDQIADEIFLLQSRNHSYKSIAEILRKCGLDVSESFVRDYCIAEQEKRLMKCEQQISRFYKPEWDDIVERSAIIERGLREALEKGSGLVLHYQPQVDLFTGRVLGAEALVRWMYNDTLIHPSEYIHIAERSGLIVDLGDWVLREACKEATRWNSAGTGDDEIMVSVNISVRQFSNSLPDMIHNVLCDTGLPTHLLGLEITESLLMGNHSVGMLQALRDSGIKLAVDDFGTGFSCLANLKDLPLDTIKIDRAFVKDLGVASKSASLVKAIVDLSRQLGADTLAEGVETEVQADALRDLGCGVCQGFLYSRPLPSAEFMRFAGRG